MTRREVGFLLIGLGAGLILTVVAVIEFVLLFHHMFIIGMQWHLGSIVLAFPFLFLLIGMTLVYRGKSH